VTQYSNPFEFEAAANLPPDMILGVFVEDHNYTRFIRSNRNVFLLGERGTGKSITLLFNSLKYRAIKAKREESPIPLDMIGIYIPCNTPLTYKQEHLLFENQFHESLLSEHYLVLTILHAIAQTLQELPATVIGQKGQKELKTEMELILGTSLTDRVSFLRALELFAQKESSDTQRAINCGNHTTVLQRVLSFSSSVLPLLVALRRTKAFAQSHFMLMIDDAHDLNVFQRRAVNSWISYRDHSVYSLKVATAKVSDPDYHTLSGGSILEGHDYIVIDLAQPFQNVDSPFAKLARSILSRRLARVGIKSNPDQFFPINEDLKKDLRAAGVEAEKEAKKIYAPHNKKAIRDYIYKYARAIYFRNRSPKANRPPYSGLDTIIHISTGVIRNLLDPCYWMYDAVYSGQKGRKAQIQFIPPPIQSEILLARSERLWKRLEDGLDSHIENCSSEEARHIYRLFDNLAILFRERLLHHKSEPRAIVFTISSMGEKEKAFLLPLLDIARRAQLLYTRYGPAKDDGKREMYYVPNRMLWPVRGLDPNGQHARVSLKAADLVAAAKGKKFPHSGDSSTVEQMPNQRELFNETL